MGHPQGACDDKDFSDDANSRDWLEELIDPAIF